MMKSFLFWCLAGWTALNLVQSFGTELFHDEAYYWLFSQHLSWGYKDHPPAAPLLIAMGWQVFQNELGVRLLMVLASTMSLWLAYKITRPADPKLFFLLAFSMVLVHIGGFMAAPDVPLLLATALFFYFLKSYLEKDNWRTALAISLALAAMAYSKYHGVLVLVLALIPNWRLLRRPSAWLIPVATLALYLPHLHWQWVNDFPSFRYHFQDRGEDKYEWTFITDYIAGQILVWGPLVSIPAFIGAVKFRVQNAFDRTMQWTLFGILGFFFYQSFSQRTEANWTAVAFLPLVYLAYKGMENRAALKKWTLRLAWVSLFLIAIFRLYLLWDFLPKGMNPRNEFHGWKAWAQDISDLAGDHPALFFNRFQKPAKYLFYSQKPGHCQTIDYDTGTQFDLLAESEEAIQGKTVFNVAESERQYPDMDTVVKLPRSGRELSYRLIPNFKSYNRVRLKVLTDKLTLQPGEAATLPVEIWNPTEQLVQFDTAGDRRVVLKYIVIQFEEVIRQELATESLAVVALKPGERRQFSIKINAPDEPGRYRYRLGFQVGDLYMGRNSGFYEMTVRQD